jgi:NAD(P)H-dependent nitrite reductase large subunit/NAD(P)H-dependent nitrite reductase small subunit
MISNQLNSDSRPVVVVVGHGMVGHRFCEKLVEFDVDRKYRIVTFCEETRAAYDRVGLTTFFAHRDAEKMMLAKLEWYEEHGIELYIGDRVKRIDRKKRQVESDAGRKIHFDYVVLATGSYPFVPDVPGIKNQGVFVYRTINDLEQMIARAQTAKRAAVIGGGLLGLEAAKAAFDLGLETHVIEFSRRLMPRQVDDAGSKLLVKKIEQLGVSVHLNKATKEVLGDGSVSGITFTDGSTLDVEMVVVSAGIRPRDELARDCELTLGPRGGVMVDDHLRTSDPEIFAIGEVAAHAGFTYGLVKPGYEMAEIMAANLCGEARTFGGSDMSTKLKLMGVDVASFGQYELPADKAPPLTFEDPFAGNYKKLCFSPDGKQLLGGILVGDASDYMQLAALAKSDKPLEVSPGELMLGKKGETAGGESMADDAQVCSCNNVTKAGLCSAIRTKGLTTLGEVKSCTKAGTGCGGCIPLVTDLLNKELAAAGKVVDKSLCEHFAYTRQELFQIVKVKELKSFEAVISSHGKGHGCEVCKPAVASILASLWNENILNHASLQDTNDRFLANIQRGGLYSVVPRVPGGEITPEKLIVLGEVGKKYGLYTKITGGQRVDLFGAQVQDLPAIWEDLIAAGFESGHAYGKSLRTVKSCVGTTWCRFGMQDSVGFAIKIENRYKGLRSPHKLKGAVSGCIRECAEAQSKDFGLIATELGYNLYVCGNGGSKPRHADLLAADLDEETAIRYLDRFLMFYVGTADRLTRTSVWLDNLPGGLEYLKSVIIDDKLGLCEEFERRMQFVVDTYRCEWREVVEDPERRKWFKQFVNTDETEPTVEFTTEREQRHPAGWEPPAYHPAVFHPSEIIGLDELTMPNAAARTGEANLPEDLRPPLAEEDSSLKETVLAAAEDDDLRWFDVGSTADFPTDGGGTIKYGRSQIAVFNFASRGEWYAGQNMCPHKKQLVLSRGLLGDVAGVPKVACPLHKKTFSLETGECLTGDPLELQTFPVKIDGDRVSLLLPPMEVLAERLNAQRSCAVHAH